MTSHTRKGPPRVAVWTGDSQDTVRRLDHDVVSFSVQKQLGQPTGRFSLTLLPYQTAVFGPDGTRLQQGPSQIRHAADLYRSIRPNSVVSIGFQGPGGILLGLVDRVEAHRSLNGGMVQFSLVITGSCLGKILTQDSILYKLPIATAVEPFRSQLEAVLGQDSPLVKALFLSGGETPLTAFAKIEDVVKWALASIVSMQSPLLATALGGNPLHASNAGKRSGRLGDFIDTSRITSWGDQRIFNYRSPLTFQGSAWDFLRSLIDADTYEVWIDYIPNGQDIPQPTLIVRTKPFDEPDVLNFAPTEETTDTTWPNLTTLVDEESQHDIEESEILEESFGFGDADAASVYQCYARFDPMGGDGAAKAGYDWPAVDTFLAPRFGARAYRGGLTMLDGDLEAKASDEDRTSDVFGMAAEFRNRFINWYRLNPWFESGSVTVPGRDHFRVGDPVRLPQRQAPVGDELGMRYYCVGVSWSWSFGSHYLSTLSLIRGHNGGMVRAIKDLIKQSADQAKTLGGADDHLVLTKPS